MHFGLTEELKKLSDLCTEKGGVLSALGTKSLLRWQQTLSCLSCCLPSVHKFDGRTRKCVDLLGETDFRDEGCAARIYVASHRFQVVPQCMVLITSSVDLYQDRFLLCFNRLRVARTCGRSGEVWKMGARTCRLLAASFSLPLVLYIVSTVYFTFYMVSTSVVQ